MIVLVDVVGEDAIDARARHLQKGMAEELGMTRVVEHRREGFCQADPFVEFADRQQPCNRGQLGRRGLDDDRKIVEKREDPLYRRLYTHRWPPKAF